MSGRTSTITGQTSERHHTSNRPLPVGTWLNSSARISVNSRQPTTVNVSPVLWAASTEIYIPLSDEHMSLAALEKAMKDNNTEAVSPSMCYAYAAIAEGAPFIMGAPNLCVDTPAMWEFSKKMNVPISGKDFKSGQTLMKTVLAPMFKPVC